MRGKGLIAAAALLGAALATLGQAHAVPGDYMFDNPTNPLGSTQDYSSDPPGGGDITATGEKVSGDPTLFSTNNGFADQGLGIKANPTNNPDNKIIPGLFAQLDLINLKLESMGGTLTSPMLRFRASGLTEGAVWEVFGTNTADMLPDADPIASGTDGFFDNLGPFDNTVTEGGGRVGIPIIGGFRYLDVTASQGAFLLAELGIDFTPVPEPGSLALLGTALVGFGVLRRRRRLVS